MTLNVSLWLFSSDLCGLLMKAAHTNSADPLWRWVAWQCLLCIDAWEGSGLGWETITHYYRTVINQSLVRAGDCQVDVETQSLSTEGAASLEGLSMLVRGSYECESPLLRRMVLVLKVPPNHLTWTPVNTLRVRAWPPWPIPWPFFVPILPPFITMYVWLQPRNPRSVSCERVHTRE